MAETAQTDRRCPMILDAARCTYLESGRQTEWLVTNGRGGYAMTCVNQMLTRRYHGLLVAAVNPPVERFLLLAKLDATVTRDGLTYELATNDYPEAVHPQGYRLLESFTPRPIPCWRWRLGDALLEQTLWMVPGEDATFVRYRLLEGSDSLQITIRPLCTSRHFHHLNHYRDVGPPTVQDMSDRFTLNWAGGRPAWSVSHNAVFKSRPDWYYQFQLAAEAARGYDHSQDLFMPGLITAELRPDDVIGLILLATTNDRRWTTWNETLPAKRVAAAPALDDLEDSLVRALVEVSGDFLVTRGDEGQSVIAGYPWFGDWGRDTFISLPGLCLVTGRFDSARRIIDAFAEHVRDGMIPNRFPDYGESPEYNTVDATLWYLHAIGRCLDASDNRNTLIKRWWPVVTEIIEAHMRGTRHSIALDGDGLLTAGEPGMALTWMDARIDERPVTPRIGKPVEINALWYNALRIATDLAHRIGDETRGRRWQDAAERCRESFNRRFWNADRACLFDVVDPDGRAGQADDSLRPNQLLALSLPHAILDRRHWRAVVDACRKHLLTPMGLRTLSPEDPAYRGRYAGNAVARDAAYHQGTVWPWLLGPFVSAYIRAHDDSSEARQQARAFFAGFEPHLSQAGVVGISEVADGDAPHAPGGCPWQAWSVAEPLRALVEDVYDRPANHPRRAATKNGSVEDPPVKYPASTVS